MMANRWGFMKFLWTELAVVFGTCWGVKVGYDGLVDKVLEFFGVVWLWGSFINL